MSKTNSKWCFSPILHFNPPIPFCVSWGTFFVLSCTRWLRQVQWFCQKLRYEFVFPVMDVFKRIECVVDYAFSVLLEFNEYSLQIIFNYPEIVRFLPSICQCANPKVCKKPILFFNLQELLISWHLKSLIYLRKKGVQTHIGT